MKTTRYFDEQVLRKRPYLRRAEIEAVLAAPIATLRQEDGRIRLWGEIFLPGEDEARVLRIVLLDDGKTVHNAFLDRSFRR